MRYMFGQSQWKREVTQSINELRQKVSELERSNSELRALNQRLNQSLKNVARKIVMRLPMSMESLEKGLMYDLIFPEELESWVKMTQNGLIVDLRSAEDFQKESIPGAVNVPFEMLSQKIDRFSKYQPLLFVCDNGIKSVSACEIFSNKAFPFLYVLKGGMAHYVGRTMATTNPPSLEAQA